MCTWVLTQQRLGRRGCGAAGVQVEGLGRKASCWVSPGQTVLFPSCLLGKSTFRVKRARERDRAGLAAWRAGSRPGCRSCTRQHRRWAEPLGSGALGLDPSRQFAPRASHADLSEPQLPCLKQVVCRRVLVSVVQIPWIPAKGRPVVPKGAISRRGHMVLTGQGSWLHAKAES